MIAVKHNGVIAVAADSRWAAGWDLRAYATAKVQQLGDLVVTVGPNSGYERVIWNEVAGLAATVQDWPEKWPGHVLGAPDASATRRMTATDGLKDRAIIVVWQGRMFEVWANGAIAEDIGGIVSTGCGSGFARGAAQVLRKRYKSAEHVAREAVSVACELSAGCAPPVICETVPAGGAQ